MTARDEPVAILCGGRGTRLQEHTHAIPKALVEIGGRPILWHVLRIYAAHGFRRFLLLSGYRGEMIAEFVAAADAGPTGSRSSASTPALDTPTGGRVAKAAERLLGRDLRADLRRRRRRRRPRRGARLPPRPRRARRRSRSCGRTRNGASRLLDDDDDAVTGFVEKPRMEQWVNGGFFFCEPRALDYIGAGLGARAASRSSGSPPTASSRGYRHERLLGLHGHLQGRGRAQRPLGDGRAAVAGLGGGAGSGLAMRRALVTGGRGFVGAWLCRALARARGGGDELRPPRPARAALDAGAARHRRRACEERGGRPARRRRCCARMLTETARSTPSSTSAAETIVGTVQADPRRRLRDERARHLDAAARPPARPGVERFVFASSDKAYGAHESCPTGRTSRCSPTAPYEASKAAADLIARILLADVTACRSRSPASPTSTAAATSTSRGSSRRRSAPRSTAARRCCAPTARPVRDLLYVEDAAAAYLAIADALDRDEVRGEAFNAGGERPYSVLEIVETITRLAGHRRRARDRRGPATPRARSTASTSTPRRSASSAAGRRRSPLEEGIGRTIAWYRETHTRRRARRLSTTAQSALLGLRPSTRPRRRSFA